MKNFKANNSHKMMTIANRIKKEAAAKWNCKVSEIDMKMCFEFAKKELNGKKFTFIEETPIIIRTKTLVNSEIVKIESKMFSAKTTRNDRKLLAIRLDALFAEFKTLEV